MFVEIIHKCGHRCNYTKDLPEAAQAVFEATLVMSDCPVCVIKQSTDIPDLKGPRTKTVLATLIRNRRLIHIVQLTAKCSPRFNEIVYEALASIKNNTDPDYWIETQHMMIAEMISQQIDKDY